MPKLLRDVDENAGEFEEKKEADPIKASAFSPLGDGVIPQEVLNEATGKFEKAEFNFLVRVTSPTSMSVTVNDGSALIKGQIIGRSSIKDNAPLVTVTLDAADPTNPRKDLIVLKTDIDKYGTVRHRGNIRDGDILIVKGTPAPSPVVAKTDAELNEMGRVRLGIVTIPAGATTIETGNIDTSRDWLGGADVSEHALAGTKHTADTLANLNAKITDATLDDASAARPPQAHTHPAAEVTDFDVEVGNQTDVAANTSARHSHANKTELDKVTDGDHDIRTDNPHGVTVAQVGAVAAIVSIDEVVARFNGVAGAVQNSAIKISDAGVVASTGGDNTGKIGDSGARFAEGHFAVFYAG